MQTRAVLFAGGSFTCIGFAGGTARCQRDGPLPAGWPAAGGMARSRRDGPQPAGWPAANGLTDPDTGLVRFGWGDYDPAVGRFTAPDPLGDTGGDHDLYEYCVDDPVTMNDPSGLIPPLVLFLAGKALALGLGLGGAYAAAAGVDAIGNKFAGQDIKGRRPGTSNTPAFDAMNRVAPMVAGASAVSAVPGMAVMGPGAVTAAAQRIGSAMATSAAWQRVGPAVLGAAAAASGAAAPADKFEKWARRIAHFAEGAAVPLPPYGGSMPAMMGGTITETAKQVWRRMQEQDAFRRQQEQNGKK